MPSSTPLPSSEPSLASSEDLSSSCSASAPTAPETHTCPYDHCKKSFSKKYNLKAHLRLHTGEQPFQCDRPDCSKKFKWRSSLSSHSIWHTRKDTASTSPPARPNPSPSPHRLAKSLPHHKNNKPLNSATKPLRKAPKPAPLPARTAWVPKVHHSAPAPALPSTANKKKRPRTEVTRKGKTGPHLKESDAPSINESSATLPSLSDFCFSADGGKVGGGSVATTGPATPKAAKRKGSRPPLKKRKTAAEANKKSDTVETSPAAAVDADADIFASPGSPVTSESGLSEHSLGLEFFSCDVLPPLIAGESEPLALGTEDVGGILEEAEVGMFGYASPSGGTLNGLDTRFGPFDLDNLQSFCLNKVERLN